MYCVLWLRIAIEPLKSILREENRILGKNKMILLLILVFGLGCAGCTEKKPAAEQGELVKSERLSEQFGSLSILLRYKTLRLKEKMIR